MPSLAETRHVLRPTPVAGLVIASVVFPGIALPGLFFDTLDYLQHAGVPILLICGAGWFGIFTLYRSRVECVRDVAKRELSITRFRWPLATTSVTVSLDAIASVELKQRNQAWCVELALRDGTRVPLTHFFSGSSSHAEACSVLRSWIGAA